MPLAFINMVIARSHVEIEYFKVRTERIGFNNLKAFTTKTIKAV